MWFLALLLAAAATAAACTIGVADGTATPDGRPLLWKVRDNGAVPDNEVYHNSSLAIPFTAVVTADGHDDSPAWMGVNQAGFALVNADVQDLAEPATRANGEFMREALGTCRSVEEFVAMLEATGGARDVHANFGVIDSTGAALIIEASRDSFWTYDTRDTERGVIVRTNFACVDTAGTGIDGLAGDERFIRSTDLVMGWADLGELTVTNLAGRHARDFSNWAGQPVDVPCFACGEPDSLPGYYDTFFSISSGGTVSAAVIQGVQAGELAWLTTLWAQLGQPNCTIASPYWPVGPVPAVADGVGSAPLCDLANDVRAHVVFDVMWYPRLVDTFALLDGEGGGLWTVLRPAEAQAIAVTEGRLDGWRIAPPAWDTVLAYQDSLAGAAYDLLADDVLTAVSDDVAGAIPASLLSARPNPFNPVTTFTFELPTTDHVVLAIFDLQGRELATLACGDLPPGRHAVTWRGRDAGGRTLPSGIYLARLDAASVRATHRVVLLR